MANASGRSAQLITGRSLQADESDMLTERGPSVDALVNAGGLGLKVVAEGIKDVTALELVHRLGADTAQDASVAQNHA